MDGDACSPSIASARVLRRAPTAGNKHVSDIASLQQGGSVEYRLHYRLPLRDLSKILLMRGIEVSHETVRDWETKLLPIMDAELCKRRHGKRRGPGASWYVDETYLKVRGKWAYL